MSAATTTPKTRALSLAESLAAPMLSARPLHPAFHEKAGWLNWTTRLEYLPSEEEIAERRLARLGHPPGAGGAAALRQDHSLRITG